MVLYYHFTPYPLYVMKSNMMGLFQQQAMWQIKLNPSFSALVRKHGFCALKVAQMCGINGTRKGKSGPKCGLLNKNMQKVDTKYSGYTSYVAGVYNADCNECDNLSSNL